MYTRWLLREHVRPVERKSTGNRDTILYSLTYILPITMACLLIVGMLFVALGTTVICYSQQTPADQKHFAMDIWGLNVPTNIDHACTQPLVKLPAGFVNVFYIGMTIISLITVGLIVYGTRRYLQLP